MRKVTVRDLRNHGARVLDQVAKGETLTVTRDGRPVAELRPLARPPLEAAELVRRRRRLPPVDPGTLREDLDRLLDPSL